MNDLTGMESRIVKEIQEPEHFHPEIEVIYVIDGKLKIHIKGMSYDLAKDDVILINSGLMHETKSAEGTLLCVVNYSCRLLASLMKRDDYFFVCNSVSDHMNAYGEIRSIFRELVYQKVKGRHRTDCLNQSILYRLLDHLIEYYLSEESEQIPGAGSDDVRLRQMIQYINQNYEENISLSEIAERLFTSASTLSRFFKKQTGLYFNDYVNRMRLKVALENLIYSDKNITKVAVDSGFSNLSVFNRLFKETYGMSPSDYRKMHTESGKAQKEAQEQVLLQVREQLQEQINEDYARQDTITVHADIDVSAGEPYGKKWNKTINVGSINQLLMANIQYHVIYLAENIGFTYARLWNVFSTKLMLTDGEHIGNYNYDKIDIALDFLVNHHLTPFLDMGIRPDTAIRTQGHPVFFDEEGVVFKSRQVWEDALRSLISHFVSRYGKAEVGRWIFELSCDNVHAPQSDCYIDDHYEYINAFEYMYQTVKSFVPDAMVGGPMSIMNKEPQFVRDFLIQCMARGCGPDFVSFLLFPYTSVGHGEMIGYRRITYPGYEREQVQMMRALIEETGADCKLCISEWNSSVSNRNYLNDSCFRAAYIAKKASEIGPYVDMVNPWMASDWVSNYFDTIGIANGGSGLLTKDTICKPVYYALQFLGGLGGILIGSGNDYIATKTEQNSYYILCFNYKWYSRNYFAKEESIDKPEMISDAFEDQKPIVLDLTLEHMQAEKYIIKKRTVSPKEGTLLTEWRKFHYDTHLTPRDVKYIRQICFPRMSMERADARNGILNVRETIEAHSVMMLHIYENRD